jgi:hypothetical protein
MTPDPDRLVNVLIARAVRGDPSPWPTDPHQPFKWKGSFEATFKAGDKQILLWAIEDCARKGAPVPKWAAQALHDIMFNGVARGRFGSWQHAFGPIRVKQQREIQPLRHMVAVWIRVCKLNESSSDWEQIFETVGKEFRFYAGKAKRYYSDMKKFMEKHGPEVWTELKRESDRDYQAI